MANHQQPQPGAKARLIREGLERHPDLGPQELAALLNRDNPGTGITISAAEVSKAKELLAAEQTTRESEPPLLFTDRIPPVRERDNPQIAPDAH